jgi:hypothetical protein
VLERRVKPLQFRFKTFLGTRPYLYFPFYRLKNGGADLLVDETTDLCVEGFPRSANSFTVSAIESVQPTPLSIAHHTHVAANAIRATRLRIPTLILIRDPGDAMISWTALRYQSQNVSVNEASGPPPIPFELQLDAWAAFYRALWPYRDHFVIGRFESVVQDLGVVIRTLNERFEVNLAVFDHTSKAVATLHDERGYHAGPDEHRAAIKKAVRAAFDQAIKQNSRTREKLVDAEEIHSRWAEMSSSNPTSLDA